MSCQRSHDYASTAKKTYSTQFLVVENPISENGNWVNGREQGLDWNNVATEQGLAFGTESGAGGYTDSTALLAGSWGPDQTVQAIVRCTKPNSLVNEEVELRLRSSISEHWNTGYEINFRCLKSEDAYTEIVRWNGRLGDFAYLDQKHGAKFGVADGDTVKATMIGTAITVYVNGVTVSSASDATFRGGNPGIGFGLYGSASNTDFGFTSFLASD